MSIATRLKAIERQRQGADKLEVRTFWHDELVACEKHQDCEIEVATGEHIEGVTHLSWES